MERERDAEPEEVYSYLGDAARQAFDELTDVFLFVKNTERRFVHCNRSFVNLMGFTAKEQLLGRRDEDVSPAYLVEGYREADLRVLREGIEIHEQIELVHTSDGSYDWFTTSKIPLRNAAGTIIGLFGVTRSKRRRDVVDVTLRSLTPAVEMMACDYDKPISVEQLAAAVSMSPSYFTRTFKKQLGMSPYRYLRKVRLLVACELLATTDLPLSAIAARTGHYDQSHLSNHVLRARGLSAGAYRKQWSSGREITRSPDTLTINLSQLGAMPAGQGVSGAASTNTGSQR